MSLKRLYGVDDREDGVRGAVEVSLRSVLLGLEFLSRDVRGDVLLLVGVDGFVDEARSV